MFKKYTRVRLLSDRFRQDGARAGDIGYIIEVYPGSEYEVEFSGEGGVTAAQIVVKGEELAEDPEPQ
jgi:hypothetical protein